jgi:two-component system LytT family response regulator
MPELKPESLRALVVDDEPLAREGLSLLLEDIPGITVIAECANGYDACDAIVEHRPDILFLDIAMPELDGFATLERLEPEDVPPAVVFVTAYDAHAVRAFSARALDYILKPVAPERLAAAVEHAAQRVREARALRDSIERETEAAGGDAPLTRLVVRDHRGTTVVPVEDIEWIEAATYYVCLHRSSGAEGSPLLLRERMHVIESRLDRALFFRSHRSAIVRLDSVRAVRGASSYEHEVVLASGAVAPLSRDRRTRLEALLKAKSSKPLNVSK